MGSIKLLVISFLIVLHGCGKSSLSEKSTATPTTTTPTDTGGTGDTGGDTGGGTSSTGTVSGKVTNGQDGAAISSATVSVVTKNNFASTTTDALGDYTLTGVPEGTQTILSSKTGYNSAKATTTVVVDQTVSNVNITMLSTVYASGKYVIVLTWGQNPNDLDSHLYVPDGVGDPDHVFYNNKGDNDGTLDAIPYSALDVDDTTSYGPETISIKITGGQAHYNGTYCYYVHKFAGTGDISTSSAIVKVYDSGTLIKTYTPPSSGAQAYWYVFKLNTTTFTEVGTYQAAAPTAATPCP